MPDEWIASHLTLALNVVRSYKPSGFLKNVVRSIDLIIMGNRLPSRSTSMGIRVPALPKSQAVR
jgi:hypothetical protein